MRKLIASAFFAAFTVHAFAAQPDADAIQKAQQAAQSWLALVDSSQYSATWDEAAAPFKSAISKPDWEVAVRAARAPAGQLENRVLISATYSEHLPGAPAGEYVVIQYKTRFGQASAIETVTPTKDADGIWRVSGYFIK
jgi:hypothetical protein